MDLHALTETIPGAITLFFGVVGSLVAGIVKVTKMWRASTDKTALSVPPSDATGHANSFGHAPTDPALRSRVEAVLLETSLAKAEWHMSDLRDEMAAVRVDMADVARDQRQTAAALQAAQLKLDAANAKIATLEGQLLHWQAESRRLESERDRADARALAATRELARCKQEAGSSNSTTSGQLITPLRPRAKE